MNAGSPGSVSAPRTSGAPRRPVGDGPTTATTRKLTMTENSVAAREGDQVLRPDSTKPKGPRLVVAVRSELTSRSSVARENRLRSAIGRVAQEAHTRAGSRLTVAVDGGLKGRARRRRFPMRFNHDADEWAPLSRPLRAAAPRVRRGPHRQRGRKGRVRLRWSRPGRGILQNVLPVLRRQSQTALVPPSLRRGTPTAGP